MLPDAVEQGARLDDLDIGAAEFRVMAALHRAAKLRGDGLLAIADGEDRQAGVENFLRRAGRTWLGDGGRAAGQDHGFGLDSVEGLFRRLERRDLAIDARLAHAARDELRHLRAKIDDQDLVVMLADFFVQNSHGSLSCPKRFD